MNRSAPGFAVTPSDPAYVVAIVVIEVVWRREEKRDRKRRLMP